ncbi:MAG: curli biogenesis system outer membrane secretion channel CsgG [Candidatus Promineifilaceae bacterium]|jgi:curli biogenesis system outer membrane secretion channel CsgG
MKKTTMRALWTAVAITLMAGATYAESGNLRYSISVAKFKNEAGWAGTWSVGDGFATIMTAALNDSDNFIVLGDSEMRNAAMAEQDLVASGRTAGGKKAPKTGRVTPAQLLVRGSITHVQNNTGGKEGGLSFKGVSLGGKKGSAEINITIYLVDTETGQVKASKSVVGKSTRKGLKLSYSGSALGGLRGGGGSEQVDNVGKACEDAVQQAVRFLTKQLEDVRWEASIILAKGEKIIINRGSREGVTAGQEFEVGDVEELVDEDTGEVLDVEVTVVGKIKADKVNEKITYCSLVEGGDGIAKGMSAYPAD